MKKRYSKIIIKKNKISNKRIAKTVQRIQQTAEKIEKEEKGLFGQTIKIKIGKEILIKGEDLDILFTVPFDDDTEANEAEIIIYNLKASTRHKIQKDDKITIEAGYQKDTGIIFSGYITKKKLSYESCDKKLTLYAMDSQKTKEREVKSKAYKSGVKASAILKDLVNMIKLPVAVFEIERDYTYKEGVTIEGELMESIRKYAQVCGVSAYINKGKIFVRSLKKGDTIKFTVKPATGLLTVEEFEEELKIEEFKDTKQYETKIKGYKIKMLLQHRITTASVIQIESNEIKGKFRVRSGEHSYDGTNFLTEIEVV